MTLFSFAVPIAHLRDLEPYQDFTFGLSFLLDNAHYERYLLRKVDEGHLTYLDNSYNETQIPATPDQVIDLYRKYFPTAVISPDSDEWDPLQTQAAWRDVARKVPLSRIMVVARTTDEVTYYLDSPGPIGVSYWWMDRMDTTYLDRVHFLGLSNLERLKAVQPPTLDTSRIVKMALRGIKFEDWSGDEPEMQLTYQRGNRAKESRFERAKLYFDQRLSDAQLELVVHNIQGLKAAVNGGSVSSGNQQLGDRRDPVAEPTSIIPHSMDVEYGVSQTLGLPSDWPHTSESDS